ncbi:MAG TPA: hypothetical protein VFQ53_20725 [Kofleriaceae bacterium]|nr:hypothetical protein [Kofleriaceae bacterium]
MRSPWLLTLLLVTACASDSLDPTDDVEAADDDGKADLDPELRVRAGDTTLWVDRALERRGDQFVLHARTSRTLVGGHAFIFDDVYGDFAQPSPRVYEVSWPSSTARGVADGVQLFTQLTFVHSSSRPDALTARVIVRPRMFAVAGSSTLALTAELTPVIVGGRTVYRLRGRSTRAITRLQPTLGTARLVDPTHFELDLDFDQLLAATLPDTRLSLTATLEGGSTTTIGGNLALAVKRLGLTSDDVEVVFPSPTCTGERLACLQALPDGALDLASCGPAIEVSRCSGQIGSFVEASAIDARLAAAEAELAGSFTADAPALVGSARASALVTGVRAEIAAALDADRGLWLLTATARSTILARDTDARIAAAYARPLRYVAPSPAAPGDVPATRQLVTDALLDYLAAQDYEHSEFGRSYDTLTQEFRAEHVASLRAFRETVVPETIAGVPNTDFYIGRWLGTHTEIAVDHATGAIQSVLVELD